MGENSLKIGVPAHSRRLSNELVNKDLALVNTLAGLSLLTQFSFQHLWYLNCGCLSLESELSLAIPIYPIRQYCSISSAGFCSMPDRERKKKERERAKPQNNGSGFVGSPSEEN
jgi:hypothetical protein